MLHEQALYDNCLVQQFPQTCQREQAGDCQKCSFQVCNHETELIADWSSETRHARKLATLKEESRLIHFNNPSNFSKARSCSYHATELVDFSGNRVFEVFIYATKQSFVILGSLVPHMGKNARKKAKRQGLPSCDAEFIDQYVGMYFARLGAWRN
jgi:hypothetical protein